MLSGGERALTAVALLFAMLEVRPVPFCVLDEVDAALDEANVGRFADALREPRRPTQFIVITHNRGTIEAADALYGVTVGDDSVSRVDQPPAGRGPGARRPPGRGDLARAGSGGRRRCVDDARFWRRRARATERDRDAASRRESAPMPAAETRRRASAPDARRRSADDAARADPSLERRDAGPPSRPGARRRPPTPPAPIRAVARARPRRRRPASSTQGLPGRAAGS